LFLLSFLSLCSHRKAVNLVLYKRGRICNLFWCMSRNLPARYGSWIVASWNVCTVYLCCNRNRWITGRVLICMWYWFTGRLSHSSQSVTAANCNRNK
jgi:hypothetical protein